MKNTGVFMSCGCSNNNQKHNSCGCNEEEFTIDPSKVREISITEDGIVNLVMVNDNEEVERELELDFGTEKEAEAWLRETFGEDLLEIVDEDEK
jgi:hypothetical protein